ncbi:hypothetical protein CASFOL_009743 [Castilleja foliolosa]|uniref:Uncharacterized protein n=2 Tax=Castilleja foliolosa TaxID=1961234 RepID=A0ABD3DEA1_9LAMI
MGFQCKPTGLGGPNSESYILDSRGALVERKAVISRERLIIGRYLVLSILVERANFCGPLMDSGNARTDSERGTVKETLDSSLCTENEESCKFKWKVFIYKDPKMLKTFFLL